MDFRSYWSSCAGVGGFVIYRRRHTRRTSSSYYTKILPYCLIIIIDADMDEERSSIKLRSPCQKDVDDLYAMIRESTDNKTKITAASLRKDLFELDRNYKPEVQSNDPCVNFDASLLRSNRPVVQAILAEKDSILVGYLMFEYYYSPWVGHVSFIVDLFVAKNHRRKGIAKKFLLALEEHCKVENLKSILISAGSINQDLIGKAIEHGFEWLRNDETDWSVLRIEFK